MPSSAIRARFSSTGIRHLKAPMAGFSRPTMPRAMFCNRSRRPCDAVVAVISAFQRLAFRASRSRSSTKAAIAKSGSNRAFALRNSSVLRNWPSITENAGSILIIIKSSTKRLHKGEPRATMPSWRRHKLKRWASFGRGAAITAHSTNRTCPKTRPRRASGVSPTRLHLTRISAALQAPINSFADKSLSLAVRFPFDCKAMRFLSSD